RLGDVAGELHAAVGDDGDVVLRGGPGAVEDGGDLRHPDARHHPSGADRVVDHHVVGDEAVGGAVDLDVVDRNGDAEVPSLQLLHHLVLVEVAPLVRRVQPRHHAVEAVGGGDAREAPCGAPLGG